MYSQARRRRCASSRPCINVPGSAEGTTPGSCNSKKVPGKMPQGSSKLDEKEQIEVTRCDVETAQNEQGKYVTAVKTFFPHWVHAATGVLIRYRTEIPNFASRSTYIQAEETWSSNCA